MLMVSSLRGCPGMIWRLRNILSDSVRPASLPEADVLQKMKSVLHGLTFFLISDSCWYVVN